jgi:D-alanyl-D-alanine carboxypeptidase
MCTALLALAGCGEGEGTTAQPGRAGDVAEVRLDEATRARLQRSFEESFATRIAGAQTPGAVVLVSIGAEQWISALGVADVASQEPMTADRRFRIASLTKTFVATAVLQLVDEGQLALDDSLDTFVPGIADGGRVTVRDLLAMSSGVWSFTSDEAVVAEFDADPTLPWSVDDTLALIRDHDAAFTPGAEVVYSDSNYVLLGEIVEQVTGRPIDEVIEQRILEPLGLAETHFPADADTGVPPPAAVGYLPTGTSPDADLQPITAINPTFGWAAGAMTATAGDLARWAAELTDGSLLSPELQAQRLETRRFTGVDVDYGYGLGVMNAADLYGHDGGIVGFGAVMMRYPEEDATFVVLVNASTNFDNASLDIFNALLGELYPDQITLSTGR